MKKNDIDLAHEMADDIIGSMNLDGAGYEEDLSNEDIVNDIVDRYMDTETEPNRSNYNDNGCTPGVWTYWTPGCRYNTDYPAFDEALKLKTGIDTRGLLDQGEIDFYTLKNCKMIFKALNPLFKRAREIVFDRIMDDPDCIKGDCF